MAETKSRPIPFSGPMVRAILDGRKTQTRRAVKPQPPSYIDDLHGNDLRGRAPYTLEDNETGNILGQGFQDDNDVFYKCPYGVPGDRLWIKTGYTTRYHPDREITHWSVDGVGFIPTHGHALSKSGKPKRDGRHPGMFMPFWLSQELWLPELEIVKIRVERLQDISEKGAKAEGAQCAGVPASLTNRGAFAKLWETINGPGSWGENPWVWVIEFRKVSEPGGQNRLSIADGVS